MDEIEEPCANCGHDELDHSRIMKQCAGSADCVCPAFWNGEEGDD